MKGLFVQLWAKDDFSQVKGDRCIQNKGFWTNSWPPIHLAYLASIARKGGHIVKIIDAIALKEDIKKVVKEIKKFKPDYIVIPTNTPSFNIDLKLIKIIKKEINSKIILFGIHSTFFHKEIFSKNKEIDIIIRREPEFVFRSLIKNWNLSKVFGISFRKGSKIFINKLNKFNKRLDELPFPARDLLPNEKYTLPLSGEKFTILFCARGCPYNCNFCLVGDFYGKKERRRTVDNVIKEIKECINLGINNFLIRGDTFTLNKKWVINFCRKIIKSSLKIKWMCNSRVDTLNKNVLKWMKKSGCWMIGIGAESANQEFLNWSNKKIKINDIENAVKLIKNEGIKVTGHFMLGFPKETKETVNKTINFCKNTELDYIHFYYLTPAPGTELYKICKDKIYKDWNYFNFSNPVMKLDYLSEKEIKKEFKKAYLLVYLTKNRICNNLKDFKAKYLIPTFLKLFKTIT